MWFIYHLVIEWPEVEWMMYVVVHLNKKSHSYQKKLDKTEKERKNWTISFFVFLSRVIKWRRVRACTHGVVAIGIRDADMDDGRRSANSEGTGRSPKLNISLVEQFDSRRIVGRGDMLINSLLSIWRHNKQEYCTNYTVIHNLEVPNIGYSNE